MNPASVYQSNKVLTASKGQLVVMLYEGAIKFLNLANKNIESNDLQNKSANINRALDIILELNMNLDMSGGGHISNNLRSIYNFMFTTLKEANASLDKEKICLVIGLLRNLHSGFKSIAC